MNHDAIAGILLVGSPLWCLAYVLHNRKVLRGGYDLTTCHRPDHPCDPHRCR